MDRNRPLTTDIQPRRIRFAAGLRDALASGYGLPDLRRDAMAGITVGIIALPLSMALAIACNVPPQHGLYTAIVAGLVIGLTGGSRVQVSGPTAAFVAILAPVTLQFGLHGLMLATLLAGLIMVALGVCGMGRLIQYIPYPVTTGFTCGIAFVIATLQLRYFLGIELPDASPHAIERWEQYTETWDRLRPVDAAIGLLTLALLAVGPRIFPFVPAPLFALVVAATAALGIDQLWPGAAVDTIARRFGDIPSIPPTFDWPWRLPDDAPQIALRDLLGPAFAIAILGAIESLLSAVIAEGMTGQPHDPDSELIGQGLGNIAVPFFGGFAATGAIARTATAIRAGSRSPVTSVVHSVFLVATMLLAAPLLGSLPMAALAALMLRTAWNMSEVRHALRMMRVSPRGDTAVLLTCFALTIAMDMVWAVCAGVVLASLLFMRRMAELAKVEFVHGDHPDLPPDLPPGVAIYRISGPLFFGAAARAVGALRTVGMSARAVVLDLRDVPHIDATGLANLESALDALHRARRFVVIAGVQTQPLHMMARAGWKHRPWLTVLRSFDDGLALARSLAPSDLE